MTSAVPTPRHSGPLLLRPWRDTLRRLPQVLVGLWLFGVGIALMVRSGLGTGPWDVFHQGVANALGLSLGAVIIATSALVLLAFVPLRERPGLGTLLNAILIGVSVDVTLPMLPEPDDLPLRATFAFFGPVLVAFASGLYIGGGLGPGPRDGIMTGLARRGYRVWKVRTSLEVSVLLVGIALGGSFGVGTVWFALGIGPMLQLFLPRLTMRDGDAPRR